MPFELFDPAAELTIRSGNLPHWFQAGVTYFITFRTEDSIPLELARSWYAQRDQWLRDHGIDPRLPTWKSLFRLLPNASQREFEMKFTHQFMEYLDRGYGACVLRRPELAGIVADCLKHFDTVRYQLGHFVVMPNHVHVLVCLLGETEIEAQCYSWKKSTATQINKALKRKGRFWQEESFDHLVRTQTQLEAFQRYIVENPAKANLRAGEYVLYCPK